VSIPALKSAVTNKRKQTKRNEPEPEDKTEKAPPELEFAEEIKPYIRRLLDVESKDRRDGGLPVSNDAVMTTTSKLVWDHLSPHSEAFCCGGLGYLVMGDSIAVSVSPDDPLFNEVMEEYGLRPHSPAANAIGLYIGQKCEAQGTQTETRVGFYYDKDRRVAYLAHRLGWFLAITKDEILEYTNGSLGQVFLYPKDFQPLDIKIGRLPKIESALDPPPGLLDEVAFEESVLTDPEKKRLITAHILSVMLSGLTAGRATL